MSKEKTEKHISKIEELKNRYRRLYTDLESLVENDKVIHNKIFVEAIFKIKCKSITWDKVKTKIREIQKSMSVEAMESSKKERIQNQMK